MNKTISSLGGRKFVLSVLGIGALVLNSKFNLSVSDEALNQVVNLIMVFVSAEGAGDIMARFRSK